MTSQPASPIDPTSPVASLPSRLAVAVLGRLRTPLTGGARLDVFDGEPTAAMDPDGRAHPYVAFWDSPGALTSSSLGLAVDELTWTFQTTCAGGDADRARRAIERTRALLSGFAIVLGNDPADYPTGWCLEVPGYDPGPLRLDDTVRPGRYYSPLLWQVTASA